MHSLKQLQLIDCTAHSLHGTGRQGECCAVTGQKKQKRSVQGTVTSNRRRSFPKRSLAALVSNPSMPSCTFAAPDSRLSPDCLSSSSSPTSRVDLTQDGQQNNLEQQGQMNKPKCLLSPTFRHSWEEAVGTTFCKECTVTWLFVRPFLANCS